MNNENELVWVIPRKIWTALSNEEGLIKSNKHEIYQACIEYGGFRYRNQVETDDRYKQVIPQALFTSGNKVFVTKRLKKQTEERLHDCYSLAIGGHLNPEDSLSTGEDIIKLGLYREMGEEVFLPNNISPKFIGVTNSEKQDVSRVHIGLWFQVELPVSSLEIRETEKMMGSFLTLNEIKEKGIFFESWSELIFKKHILNIV